MSDPRNVAFHDLPAGAFPFTIEFRDTETDELLHSVTVTGPGALQVPGFGRQVSVVMITPDGERTRRDPP